MRCDFIRGLGRLCRREEGRERRAKLYPTHGGGVCSARWPAVGRSVGRHRAGMNWCAMPSRFQGCTIPHLARPAFALRRRCRDERPFSRRGHALPNRASVGAEVENVPHHIGTHKQGAAEWVRWGISRPRVSYGFAPDHQARYDRVNACGHSLRWHVLRKGSLLVAVGLSFFRITFVEPGAQHAMLPWRGS